MTFLKIGRCYPQNICFDEDARLQSAIIDIISKKCDMVYWLYDGL